MSDDVPSPQGTRPVIFKTPTLGHAVCLGELYDQRTGQFLGVQLYPQDNIQEIVTDVRHTALSVKLSTTYEEKASLFDIEASLSLEVLAGLVKVSGSAAYVNDSKSNTHEQAFALALKMRLSERRILFAEDELGRNVLEVAQEDYIKDGLATHFVSAIVYGGNFIVNLVARQSELSEEERIQGKLEAQFNDLKGAISLEGSIEAKISGEFKDMNDKFDLMIHGDVALEKVPINPEDVLDAFPDAAALITAGGGVPISVTLQPIPKKLITGSLVYKLDADFVDDVLKAFSMLDDLRSRFVVLDNATKTFQYLVSQLAQAVRLVSAKYTKDHSKLLHELRDFLYDYQHGEKPDYNSIFVRKEGKIFVITGDKVLEEAQKLYDYHQDPDQTDDLSAPYPSSLVGLENELTKFQNFASDVRRMGESLDNLPHSNDTETWASSIYLSNIEDVCRAVRIQNKIPLFIMPPLYLKASDLTSAEQTPDLAIVRFLALFRNYAAYFKDPSTPGYILYAENPKQLELRLPNDGTFAALDSPSIFIGQVDSEGTLTWSPPPPAMNLSLKLHHKPSSKKLGDLSFDVDIVDVAESFSFQIRGKAPSTSSDDNLEICIVQLTETKDMFLRFRTPLKVTLKRRDNASAVISSSSALSAGKQFTATFVQDTKNHKWILYLEDRQVGTVLYTGTQELLQSTTKLGFAYPDSDDVKWWGGEVYEVKAFSYALTEDEITAEIQNSEAATD